jgi:hypothetical protein
MLAQKNRRAQQPLNGLPGARLGALSSEGKSLAASAHFACSR